MCAAASYYRTLTELLILQLTLFISLQNTYLCNNVVNMLEERQIKYLKTQREKYSQGFLRTWSHLSPHDLLLRIWNFVTLLLSIIVIVFLDVMQQNI